MRFLFAQRFQPAQARRPTFLNNLFAPPQSQCVRRHVLGDHRAGPDIGARADLHRHQRRIRADERPLADGGAMLGAAVVIAGNGAGSNIGVGADNGVADVAQMIGLGAGFDRGFFDLDEIADAGAVAEPGARSLANGPTDTPLPTWAPTRWENEWMTAPSSTVTFSPNTT